MKKVNFDNLLGEKASLYYNNEVNRFQLGSVIFEAIEDENNGYRSMRKEVRIVNDQAPKKDFLAEVEIRVSEVIDSGYDLVDTEDDYIWLTFGTNNSVDGHPSFIFLVYAKPGIEEQLKQLIK